MIQEAKIMNKIRQIGVPNNFNELLPELKAKTLKWETVCYSGTKINNNAKISFYASLASDSYGNIILSPGLGTNTDIDPLMKTITFWSLTHKYNIITFDTFLGQFCPIPSFETAQKNTYSEFVSLLETCIKFIEPYSVKQNAILIGHSAGATGIIDALNNIAENGNQTHIRSVMLFAPWASKQWHDYLKGFIYKHYQRYCVDDPHQILPICNIFNQDYDKSGYVTILPQFFTDMENSSFRPDLMNKWQTYITLVAGEKDKKVPTEILQKRFEELSRQSNRNMFKFIVLPDERHSFLNIHSDTQSVINLIKSQRIKNKLR